MLTGNLEGGSSPPLVQPHLPRRISLRTSLSRFRALVLTALGIPSGFFIQYAYTKHLQPVRDPYPEVEALCAASGWREFVTEMETHRSAFSKFGDGSVDPVLGRGMFPALDGMAAYTAVRKFKPNRIVEIGSGDSTYFLARGVRDNGSGQITCIDPQPRREVVALGLNLLQRLMTNEDADLADELDANDILFIDSSHLMLPGMDVDIQFNRLFPRLKPGVIVHVHDIFLPDDYPPHWRARHYSEQNALIGWILSGYFEVIWPAQYVVTRHPEVLDGALGHVSAVRGGGSIWLRRRGGPPLHWA